MPELPIGRQAAKPTDEDLAVGAVMAFPRDGAERLRALARFHEFVIGGLYERAAKGQSEKLPPELAGQMLGSVYGKALEPYGGLATLLGAPSGDAMYKKAMRSLWPGSIAGDLLLYLLQMRAAGIPASVNKAIAIELVLLEEMSKEPLDWYGGKTERYVREEWERFKPACHLWAAFRTGIIERRKVALWSPGAGNLPEFLGLAEAILSAASTLQSRSRSEPLLSAAEMWRVPPDYPLPTVTFTPRPMDDWMLTALQRFKSLR